MKIIDTPLPLKFDRPFYVDSLLSTHKQLLVKSPMANRYDERIDIVFKGVEVMHLAVKFSTLEVRWPTPDEAERVVSGFVANPLGVAGNKLYIVSGGGLLGSYVVAVDAYMVKSQLHGANVSPLFFDHADVEKPEVVYRLVE